MSRDLGCLILQELGGVEFKQNQLRDIRNWNLVIPRFTFGNFRKSQEIFNDKRCAVKLCSIRRRSIQSTLKNPFTSVSSRQTLWSENGEEKQPFAVGTVPLLQYVLRYIEDMGRLLGSRHFQNRQIFNESTLPVMSEMWSANQHKPSWQYVISNIDFKIKN